MSAEIQEKLLNAIAEISCEIKNGFGRIDTLLTSIENRIGNIEGTLDRIEKSI